MVFAVRKFVNRGGAFLGFLAALYFIGPILLFELRSLHFRVFQQTNTPEDYCQTDNLRRLYWEQYRKYNISEVNRTAGNARHRDVQHVDDSAQKTSPTNSPSARQWDNHEWPPKTLDDSLKKISILSGKHRDVTVAFGCGLTTRSSSLLAYGSLEESLTFFHQLLPSFLMTASVGYRYKFYIAYDYDDPILGKADGREIFTGIFNKIVQTDLCRLLHVDLVFVRCNHSGKPAWAQNDAMMAAYRDDASYFYMVNDDTLMITPGWTEAFIEMLQAMKPPYMGVVGPAHTGGNEKILTYHFLHRTHIDIFHYFYPRNFTGWYADDWITTIYMPNNSHKLESFKLSHTEHPTRYISERHPDDWMKKVIDDTRPILHAHLKATHHRR